MVGCLGAVTVSIGLLQACGSATPTAPAGGALLVLPSTLNLRLGAQWLTLNGLNISTDPTLPACAPLGSPPSGTSVTTAVVVSHENGDWVARSANAAAGDIELRFHETQAEVTGVDVVGTIRGTGSDMAYNTFYIPTDSRASFNAGVVVEGNGDPRNSYVGGRMSGAIRYSDGQGHVGTCSVILWTLLPAAN